MILELNDSALASLISQVVSDALSKLEEDRLRVGGRLAYTEAEAAALLGVERYVLRDCRLRGEVTGSKVGKRIVYSRDELLELLRRNRLGSARRNRQ